MNICNKHKKMRFLLLNGHGISFKVEKAKLLISDGRYSVEKN